jgi:FkbM family methyltransferase
LIPSSVKSVLKALLLKFPALYEAQRRIRIARKKRANKPLSPTEHIETVFPHTRPVRFVQVGSNDGRSGDPINMLIKQRGNWSGVFVEPVPYAFARLQDNYGLSDKFRFEQLAIGEDFETKTFYYVAEDAKKALGDQLPTWYDQLASFDRNHILKHLDGVLEPYIQEVDIDCVPLQHIFDKNNVEQIDLVHIDTEGFDYHVLKQVDLERYAPSVVLFEHKHLNEEELKSAFDMLQGHGYRVQQIGGDTIAFRNQQAA